jgi:hypothetical protein
MRGSGAGVGHASSRRGPRADRLRLARRLAALGLISIGGATASSAVTRMRLEVQDWDCPPAPASCARPVLVAGYPFPFISDYHGISVVGRVSVLGGLLGEDHFHWRAFAMNVGVFAVLSVAGWTAVGALRARRRRGER